MGTRGVSVVVGAVVLLTPVAAEAAKRAPDLVVSGVTLGQSTASAGGALPVRESTKNRGKRKAGKSVTAYYLSHDAKRSVDDVRIGQRTVGKLRPRAVSAKTAQPTIPRITPAGSYRLIACADDRRKVREANERNNCRAASTVISLQPLPLGPGSPTSGAPVAPGGTTGSTGGDTTGSTTGGGGSTGGGGGGGTTPPDADADGTPDASDCAPADAQIHPGAADAPDLGFVDSNCDGIDGDAAKAIFVAPTGNDADAGTMAAPKQTLAAAMNAAVLGGLHEVYVMAGAYPARLNVVNRVSVYGGYASDWSRPALAATVISNSTENSGRLEGAVASGVSSATTLQMLTINAGSSVTPGVSVYGIRAANSPALVLQALTVTAGSTADAADGAGQAGSASNGGNGQPGGPGVENSTVFCSSGSRPIGGPGGTSPVSHPGATGGQPGLGPQPGDTGGTALGGALGGQGTPPDLGGWTPTSQYLGQAGADGADGSNGDAGFGAFGLAGFTVTGGTGGGSGGDGFGGGGGGGGGGGETDCDSYGGGGGGGGGGAQGGAAGDGGGSAGGSFAVYLWASDVTLSGSSLTSGAGGDGGSGGAGQAGGAGGAPGAVPLGSDIGNPYGGSNEQDDGSNGGRGGQGGDGGHGGAGGGGAGGSSIGVVKAGGSNPTLSGNTISPGSAGAGGASDGNPGPAGTAADVFAAL